MNKKIILIGLSICLILINGCHQVPDGFIIKSNTTQSCIITCDSGYYWDGNGTCIYNGTYHFEDDNCIVEVTQIDKGSIIEYFENQKVK